MANLKVVIAGAGNIGKKRAQALADLKTDVLLGAYDVNKQSAEALVGQYGGKVYESWQEVLKDEEVDAVVIATTTDFNVKMSLEALKAGKHVLVEKPLGSTKAEALKIAQAQKKYKKYLKVGFNHRHHPAVWKAHELFSSGVIGKLLYIRSIYGHGARPGYDTEWRMQKKYSAGGELFDQGVHIIDLASWFAGDFSSVLGQTRNLYWKKSDLEDNAFCQLNTKKKQVVDFHVSLTQWRNRFQFEIYGDKGYLLVSGLGKSYGPETLTLGTEVGQGKVPQEEVFEFPGEDISWRQEWSEFKNAITEKRQPLASASDNLKVCKVLEALYKSAKSGKIIKI